MPRGDAGRSDAAVGGRDAHEGGRGGTGGSSAGTAHAGGGGDGGKDAGPFDAPKANGETCTESSECASDNCKMGGDGRRCYGLIAVDRPCSDRYDCDGYACMAATADAKNSVCVDTSQCSSQNACAQDYWAATCQLEQVCSAQSSSFNDCYRKVCTNPPDASALCRSQLAIAKGLIAARCCPPAGAYHSSCDPAPQCGCDDGEKCDVTGEHGQTSCGPAGSVDELEECAASKDCKIGFVCTTTGCRRYCDGPGDQVCLPNGACQRIVIGKSNMDAPGLFVCTRRCDPTSPYTANGPFAACGAGQRCEPAPDGNSDCFEGGGTGRQGASCNDSATADNKACAPGFTCVMPRLTCEQYCKVAANDCEVGTCVPDTEKKFAYDIEIGHCVEP